MILINREATDEDLMECVRDWVEMLACGKVDEAFRLVNIEGYELQWEPRHLHAIFRDFHSKLYPGVTNFKITSWKTAESIDREPQHKVVWYKPNPCFLAIISYDMPLNGQWSDLQAVFALMEEDQDQLLLILEDIEQDWQSDSE